MTLTLRAAMATDRGVIRKANQDSGYAGPRLIAVADGMGGVAGGDVASQLAIAALRPLDGATVGEPDPAAGEADTGTDLRADAAGEGAHGGADGGLAALRLAVEQANERIRAAGEADPALEGMGTTLTAILLTGHRAALAHVGDSRAYLLRDGEMARLTRDDTYVQLLVDQGAITAEQAGQHPHRSVVVRVLRGGQDVPAYTVMRPRAGDRYLLCSDGLCSVVDGSVIAEALRGYAEPGECAGRLVELAVRAGAPDNVTAVVADVVTTSGGRLRRLLRSVLPHSPSVEER